MRCHARLIGESDDDAFGTIAGRETHLERRRHAVFPVRVGDESWRAKAGDRVSGVGAQFLGQGDRRRPGDDDEGSDLGFQGRLEGPVGHCAPADVHGELVGALPESASGTPGQHDEGGGGGHPCILPDQPVIPSKP